MPAIRSPLRPAIRAPLRSPLAPALGGSPSLTAQVQALFAGGKVGGMWDFGDTATLFQDSQGTAPVTAVTQPIGMVLDKSQGLALGAEVVPSTNWNGGYTTNGAKQIPTGWIEYNSANVASATVSPNSYQFTATAHLAGIQLASPAATVIGRFNKYTIRARKTAFVSGTPSLQLYTGEWQEIVPSGAAIGDWHTKTIYVLNSTFILLTISSFNGSASWEVEYLTVKEQFGNHATQPTAGSRPLYQVVSSYGCAQFDATDDALLFPAITFGGAFNTFVAGKVTGGTNSVHIWRTAEPSGSYWGVYQSGSAASPTGVNAGSPTYSNNGIAVSPQTRAQIYTLINGVDSVLESTGIVLSEETALQFAGYPSAQFQGNAHRVLMISGTLTAGEKLLCRQWAAQGNGVTVV